MRRVSASRSKTLNNRILDKTSKIIQTIFFKITKNKIPSNKVSSLHKWVNRVVAFLHLRTKTRIKTKKATLVLISSNRAILKINNRIIHPIKIIYFLKDRTKANLLCSDFQPIPKYQHPHLVASHPPKPRTRRKNKKWIIRLEQEGFLELSKIKGSHSPNNLV